MGQMIELTASDGHKLAAYRAEPSGASKGGVVVIQEIFGVNGHIRAVADGYAEAGYTAIAPAMFDRLKRDVELGYEAGDTLPSSTGSSVNTTAILEQFQVGTKDYISMGGNSKGDAGLRDLSGSIV